MSEPKKQERRYNDQEMQLIAATFKEQDGLLILFRRFLLQDPLTKDESAYLQSTMNNPEILAILRKTLNPDLDKRAPIHQTVDLYSGMDLQPTVIDHAVLQIKVRMRVKQYLNQQFSMFEGTWKEQEGQIIFDEMVGFENDKGKKTDEETYIDFVARNFLLGYIDSVGLRQLLILASQSEDPEAVKEKLMKNSSK